MTKTTKTIATKFRVYPDAPDHKNLYYMVYVGLDLKAMREHASHYSGKKREKIEGFTITLRRLPNGPKMTKLCGEIHLHVDHLFADIVSHECTHAAIGWADRLGFLKDVMGRQLGEGSVDAEERFCDAVGFMTEQCIGRMHKAKLVTLAE